MIPVPEYLIGCVIGKGGLNIKEIRERSRATVKIADPINNQPDRIITIIGTRTQNEVAVSLVYEKLNSYHPNVLRGEGGGNERRGKTEMMSSNSYDPNVIRGERGSGNERHIKAEPKWSG